LLGARFAHPLLPTSILAPSLCSSAIQLHHAIVLRLWCRCFGAFQISLDLDLVHCVTFIVVRVVQMLLVATLFSPITLPSCSLQASLCHLAACVLSLFCRACVVSLFVPTLLCLEFIRISLFYSPHSLLLYDDFRREPVVLHFSLVFCTCALSFSRFLCLYPKHNLPPTFTLRLPSSGSRALAHSFPIAAARSHSLSPFHFHSLSAFSAISRLTFSFKISSSKSYTLEIALSLSTCLDFYPFPCFCVLSYSFHTRSHIHLRM
jgi:hypothetical protein